MIINLSFFSNTAIDNPQRGRVMSMEIRPIKNDRDHREALKEIERLMEARLNTPEGDRLEVLVTLVEAWEGKHWPINAPDPSSSYSR